MNIRKFYERNKPIFVIGIFMAIVFIGLIVFYGIKPREETDLSKLNETDREFYKVAYENLERDESNVNENVYVSDFNTNTSSVSEEENEMTRQQIDEKYGVLKIEYTEEGFKPRVVRAALGQEVLWTNTTNRTIYLHQRRQTYPELRDLVEIMPGDIFNFRMAVLGIWTYDENESGDFGSIEVKDPKYVSVPDKNLDEAQETVKEESEL